MTIWSPRPTGPGHVCTKIPYKGYEISIAMDDSCGAFRDLVRSKIVIFKGDKTLRGFFDDGSAECDATAENLKAIFDRIDGLEP